MKSIIISLAALVAGFALVGSAAAQSESRWVKGTNYMVSEDDATGYLEDRFDYAYCRGIKRYGYQGEFPDEEFVIFECTVEMDSGTTCSGLRVKSVKGSRRGYFTIKPLPKSVQYQKASCY